MLVLWYHSVTGKQVKKEGMKQMTKISKSISVAEMMHMRNEERLSNGEIAKRLGCNISTVIRHIGKQPSGMRKPRGSNRKKDELPALPENTEVPEMPHKSFKERLEEMGNFKPFVTEEEADAQVPTSPVGKYRIKPVVPVVPLLGDDEEEMAKNAASLYERKMPENRKANADGSSHIPELVAMFGTEAVIAWLKVSLYDMRIPDSRPMTRQKMLEMLKNMNAGGANA